MFIYLYLFMPIWIFMDIYTYIHACYMPHTFRTRGSYLQSVLFGSAGRSVVDVDVAVDVIIIVITIKTIIMISINNIIRRHFNCHDQYRHHHH
jgi:hypothetical protein